MQTLDGPDFGAWVFLDLADALRDEGDHVTLDLAGLSITAQNFRGAPRAFWNVCSHRAIKMRDGGDDGDSRRGHGVLRCPYHGWTYDGAGVPRGIPDNEWLYRLDERARCDRALRPAGLMRRGDFLFVRPHDGPDGGDAGAAVDAAVGAAFGGDVPLPSVRDAWCVRRAARVLHDIGDHIGRDQPGLTVLVQDGWIFWRRILALSDGVALASALYHPQDRDWREAPLALRAYFSVFDA